MKKYIVQDGDTMVKISRATGVRLNLLMAANPQIRDPNKIQVGSVLSIPELGKPTDTLSAAPPPTQPGSLHAPPPPLAAPPGPLGLGANAWGHAGMFSGAVSGPGPGAGPGAGAVSGPGPGPGPGADAGAGPGAGAAAGPGAGPGPGAGAGAGAVPSPESVVSPFFGFVWPHVVKSGETWQSVARLYDVPEGNVRRMNPGKGEQLSPGDILYIPGATGQTSGAQVPVPPPDADGVPQGAPAYGGGTPAHWPPMPLLPGSRFTSDLARHGYPVFLPVTMAPSPYGWPGPVWVLPPYGPTPLPPEATRQLWGMSRNTPAGWDREWDESSSYESDWGSDIDNG